MGCATPALRAQRTIASLFLWHRGRLDLEDPSLYENPIFSYPEVHVATEAILSTVDAVAEHCWEAAVLEVLLDTERHLSLLARTSSVEELEGNASVVCRHLDSYERLLRRRPPGEAAGLATQWSVHLERTWQRLGLAPGDFCAEGSFAASFAQRDATQCHPRCRLRDEVGFTESGAGSCSVPSFCERLVGRVLPASWLPEAALQAMAARHAEDRSLRRPPLGCGTRWRTARLPETSPWREDGMGMYARTCKAPFLSYWPIPVVSITRCKYCGAASILGLRPGDRVLDFGAGCGLGAAWLAEFFGAEVVALDAFAEHAEAAAAAARRAGAPLAAACVGDLGALEAFPDGSFDAVLTNSALQASRSFALQCAALRAHLARLLRPGGVLWWGDLNSTQHEEERFADREKWGGCLAPLVEAGELAYTTFLEMDTFGVTETWSPGVFSLLVVRMQPREEAEEARAVEAKARAAEAEGEEWQEGDRRVEMETRRQASLYGCAAAARLGFPAASGATAMRFLPGPSFWSCASARLQAASAQSSSAGQPKRLAPRLWSLEHFASEAEVIHLRELVEAWRLEASLASAPNLTAQEGEPDAGFWVDDVIAPTGLDAVLDGLEDRLERDWGLPRAHSDPWHVLHYEPGYRAHWRHTDCNHPGFNPANDRLATALLWLSPCVEPPCVPEALGLEAAEEALHRPDGATVFPRYGARVRLPPGGLALYSSVEEGPDGGCDQTSEHFAAPLAQDAKAAKLLLQKWYYAKPVEPSSPPTPRKSCTPPPSDQCKRYLMAPGSSTAEVQAWLAKSEAMLETAPTLDGPRLREFLEMKDMRMLKAVLEQEVAPGSLGRSANFRALYLAGNFLLIGWQVGLGGLSLRHEALEWLRASLRRCPVCEDALSLISRALADENAVTLLNREADEIGEGALPTPLGPSAAKQEAREALGYARRLMAMGAGGAASLERKMVRRLAEG